jgi:hypothetical protein
MEINFSAEIWEWQGQGSWFFASLPKEYYDALRNIASSTTRGFGSIKIKATIGASTWNTSIFPDTKSSTYLLPVKKSIRKAENINTGDKVDIYLLIFDI